MKYSKRSEESGVNSKDLDVPFYTADLQGVPMQQLRRYNHLTDNLSGHSALPEVK